MGQLYLGGSDRCWFAEVIADKNWMECTRRHFEYQEVEDALNISI